MAASNPKDVGSHLKVIKGINPTNDTGTTIEGTGFNRVPSEDQNFLSCVLQGAVGTVNGGTLTTFDVKLQESSDDGASDAYVDVTGAAITQITAADTEGKIDIDLSGREKFVRAVVTTAVSGGTVPVSATFTFGGAALKPPV